MTCKETYSHLYQVVYSLCFSPYRDASSSPVTPSATTPEPTTPEPTTPESETDAPVTERPVVSYSIYRAFIYPSLKDSPISRLKAKTHENFLLPNGQPVSLVI